MTWALEHSDKAVTATSEQAFSVENTKTLKIKQPEDLWTQKTHHSMSLGINCTNFDDMASGIYTPQLPD